MTRPSWFDSPFLLGFDRMQEMAERAARAASDGYPPYNIEDRGEGRIRITLAVAGFAPEDLSAAVIGSQLVIRGDKPDGGERSFLHRGIAARRFQRTFVLADGYDVETAQLENGLLHIDVERPEPTVSERRIEIKNQGA